VHGLLVCKKPDSLTGYKAEIDRIYFVCGHYNPIPEEDRAYLRASYLFTNYMNDICLSVEQENKLESDQKEILCCRFILKFQKESPAILTSCATLQRLFRLAQNNRITNEDID